MSACALLTLTPRSADGSEMSKARQNQCGVRALACHCGECALNVVEDPGFDRQWGQSERFGGCRSFLKLQLVDHVGRVPEDGHALGNRNSILEELDAFRRQLDGYERQSG